MALRYISWLKVSLFFFSYENLLAVNFLSRVAARFTFTRPSATKAYYPLKNHQKRLEKITNGDYKAGHPVTTDEVLIDPQGDVPFKHHPTHGAATNPSKLLSAHVDLKGDPVTQNAIYPSQPKRFPATWLDKEVQNSETFYQRADVIANDKVNSRTGMSISKEKGSSEYSCYKLIKKRSVTVMEVPSSAYIKVTSPLSTGHFL